MVLDRFDGYWGKTPDIAKATYVWRAESSLRAAMVQTGEAQLTPAIAIQDANNPETDFSYLNSETTAIRIDTSDVTVDLGGFAVQGTNVCHGYRDQRCRHEAMPRPRNAKP